MSTDTRQRILEINYAVMHQHGFQGMRADKVIKELGITKGALYHYFPNKQALGYSIVDELIAPRFLDAWRQVAQGSGNPLDHIEAALTAAIAHQTDAQVSLGCPLNNLMQEMSPLDEGFRSRLLRIIEGMQNSVCQGLTRGQREGLVKAEVDPNGAAAFIISAVEGAFGIAKVKQDAATLHLAIKQLITYVRSLAS